jgi:hypothetical protein
VPILTAAGNRRGHGGQPSTYSKRIGVRSRGSHARGLGAARSRRPSARAPSRARTVAIATAPHAPGSRWHSARRSPSRSQAPSMRLPMPARTVGVVVMWLGLALRVWAIAALGRAFRITIEVDPEQAIVSTGPGGGDERTVRESDAAASCCPAGRHHTSSRGGSARAPRHSGARRAHPRSPSQGTTKARSQHTPRRA